MEIRKRTLVACDLYLPANRKMGFGIVLNQDENENSLAGRSFRVKIIYPDSAKNSTYHILETEMVPLAQDCDLDSKADHLLEHLPEVFLTLIRAIDGLKRENQFLKQTINGGVDGVKIR